LLLCGQNAQHAARVFAGDRSKTFGFGLEGRDLLSELRGSLLGRLVRILGSLRSGNRLGSCVDVGDAETLENGPLC
jgi:hypothetical protein